MRISNGLKKYFKILIIATLFFSAIFLVWHNSILAPEIFSSYETKEIKIGEKIINVEIADTAEKQEKGLSGRKSLAEKSGMLFVFDRADYYSFWMKDMNFGLDFVWIKGNEIMEITNGVRPEDYQPFSVQRGDLPESLMPKNKIDKVLELNAGAADRLGLQEGDILEF